LLDVYIINIIKTQVRASSLDR